MDRGAEVLRVLEAHVEALLGVAAPVAVLLLVRLHLIERLEESHRRAILGVLDPEAGAVFVGIGDRLDGLDGLGVRLGVRHGVLLRCFRIALAARALGRRLVDIGGLRIHGWIVCGMRGVAKR